MIYLINRNKIMNTNIAKTSKTNDHVERYISSIAGGAMLGAITGNILWVIIGGVVGMYIANILANRDK